MILSKLYNAAYPSTLSYRLATTVSKSALEIMYILKYSLSENDMNDKQVTIFLHVPTWKV